MKRVLLITAILLTCCSACRPFYDCLNKAPAVESVQPDGCIQAGATISVKFSCKMDKNSVESAFRLSCSSLPVSGSFSWNNPSEVVFFPEMASAHRDYVLHIAYTARSAAGIPMKRSFTHPLDTAAETPLLELVSISPEPDDRVISPTDSFHIQFSNPVDRNSFYSAFSMSPQVQGHFQWDNADSQVDFIPQFGLSPELHYQLEITTECRSFDNRPLRCAVQRHYRTSGIITLPVESFCFSTGSGERVLTPEPDTCNHLSQGEEFSILFSRAVLPALHSSAAKLQPDPGVTFSWSRDHRRLTLHMPATPPPERVFQLALGETSYYLQWDGGGTAAIELAGVAYCNDSSSASAHYRRIYLNDLLDFKTSAQASLELAFFHSPAAEIPVTRLMEALNLYTSNGAAILRLTDLQAIDTAGCAELNDLHPDSIFRLRFSIQRYPNPGLLQLQIAGTLEDSLANTPSQDLAVSYNL